VFLKEIYLAILERKSSPTFQKQYFLEIIERLAADPRVLVELYLNYDCDSAALENIFQGYFHPCNQKRKGKKRKSAD
jgi:brefeldin A-inhibited guanine nucleotide-exchange protein